MFLAFRTWEVFKYFGGRAIITQLEGVIKPYWKIQNKYNKILARTGSKKISQVNPEFVID